MVKKKTGTSFSFSGHETFTFRYGWLKKVIDAISDDPAFLSNERAMVKLGVGKNMVQSMRHWCLAARLIRETREANHDKGFFVPTEIGRLLFSEKGFDPFLEDPATLWIIHWQIASNIKLATTWFWVFSYWNATEFSKDKLASEIYLWLDKCGAKPLSENTLKRDIDCFVRTYVQSRQIKTAVLEDTLDCPLVDLRLIIERSESKFFQFQRGPQASLPDSVLAFALAAFWRASEFSAESLAFERIAYDPGSPGRVFKLDEDSLIKRLESIDKSTEGVFSYDETAGLKQVYRHSKEEINPIHFLETYYRDQKVKSRAAI